MNLNFFTFLTALFILAKVTGYLDWGWLWVLSPMCGQLALIIFAAVMEVVAEATDDRKQK